MVVGMKWISYLYISDLYDFKLLLDCGRDRIVKRIVYINVLRYGIYMYFWFSCWRLNSLFLICVWFVK